jgi:hypothetical protein
MDNLAWRGGALDAIRQIRAFYPDLTVWPIVIHHERAWLTGVIAARASACNDNKKAG